MEFLEAACRRRSVRAYKNIPVTKKDLDYVVQCASLSPVGMGAYDCIHITVINDAGLIDAIDKAAARKLGREDAHPVYGAPALVVVSTKPGKIPIPGIESANCGCIMQTMMLAAADIGLGSVYLLAAAEALANDPTLVDALGLPEDFKPTAIMALGYPDGEIEKKAMEVKIGMNTLD
ncbi:MAG: nitroreductase family protein [Clostridiales bacterium]|nr:nitroreductase family protein [Clostridiales bacterium]